MLVWGAVWFWFFFPLVRKLSAILMLFYFSSDGGFLKYSLPIRREHAQLLQLLSACYRWFVSRRRCARFRVWPDQQQQFQCRAEGPWSKSKPCGALVDVFFAPGSKVLARCRNRWTWCSPRRTVWPAPSAGGTRWPRSASRYHRRGPIRSPSPGGTVHRTCAPAGTHSGQWLKEAKLRPCLRRPALGSSFRWNSRVFRSRHPPRPGWTAGLRLGFRSAGTPAAGTLPRGCRSPCWPAFPARIGWTGHPTRSRYRWTPGPLRWPPTVRSPSFCRFLRFCPVNLFIRTVEKLMHDLRCAAFESSPNSRNMPVG